MDYEALKLESRGAINIVPLSRPDALNALSTRMVEELADYVASLKHNRKTRVVILRGEGRALCAGLDIKENRPETDESRMERSWRVQTSLADVLKAMRKPFIALGHGSACGGGFSLMLASDVRFGAPDLRMNAAHIKIGLGGADIGSSYFLPGLFGASLASELLLTGRFIHADRALRLGLLSDVVLHDQLLDTGLSLAQEMIANAATASR